MNRLAMPMYLATAFVIGLLLGGFVLASSTWALALAAVAAGFFGVMFGVVSMFESRAADERERRDQERLRRLHSEHPLSTRYGGDRFDVL